jgi:hypothetical protein
VGYDAYTTVSKIHRCVNIKGVIRRRRKTFRPRR